ncbi:hypothetical protein SSBR45G_14350 [Bradyrhizobium sp. SSBR45G]|nr:hypothetical protein SSBR45G_14350 [Bradyrhizobium sp. SSBR45G]GLH84144.1 hypothetical protein SSBR45R_16040 [Bradyrhizobium sp. SSBR45R]
MAPMAGSSRPRGACRPSGQAILQATKQRAEELQAKGKTVDFKKLLRMEPDGGTINIRKVSVNTGRAGSVRKIYAWLGLPVFEV